MKDMKIIIKIYIQQIRRPPSSDSLWDEVMSATSQFSFIMYARKTGYQIIIKSPLEQKRCTFSYLMGLQLAN